MASDTNRVALRYSEESTLGQTPATPVFTVLPYSGAPNLAFTPATEVSNLIRDDRQISDLITVGGEGAGDANSELAFGFHDDLLQAAFFSTWQTRLSWRNDRGATEVTNIDGTGEAFTVVDLGSSLVQDDIVLAEGNAIPQNNGFFIVAAAPSNTSVPVTGDLADETPGADSKLHHVGRQAATGDIVATTSPDGLTSTVLDFTTLDLEPGDWIKLNGSGGTWPAANNDWVRILTVATNVLTFDSVPAGWMSDPGTGATVQIYHGERLVNGVLRRQFSLEFEYTDHSPVDFQYLRGMVHGQLAVSAASQSIVTANHTFLGLGDNNVDDVYTQTRIAGATTLDAIEASVLNSSSNVARLAEGGQPIVSANFVTEYSFTINNNLRAKNAVSFVGPADIGAGEFNVTGALSSYFDNTSIAEKVVAGTETSIDSRFQDSQGHIMLFDAPRVKFSEGAPEVPGKNEDVVINPNWQAIRDEVFGYTFKAMRFYGVQ